VTLSAAFDLAEQTGEAQTVDRAEHRLRIRLRISEYGDRQLALAVAGGVSEALAVAIAVEAGFGKWTTDRSGAALLLTETEAADVDSDDTPPWEDRPASADYSSSSVLQRVSRGEALCNADRAEVITLTQAGLMSSTPTFTRGEVCPYRLTDEGRRALRS
jgi:hypothetical protein